MKKLLSLIAALALAFTLAGCGSKEAPVETVTDPSYIKTFETTNFAGDTVTNEYLASNDLNVIVVGHSQINNLTNNNLTDFGSFARDGKVSVKAIIADMDTDEGKATMSTFLKLFSTDFDVLYPTADLHKNVIDSITSFPTILFIDKEGNKVRENFEFTSRSDLAKVNEIIDELIK